MDTQAPDSAFFNGAFQIRRFHLRGVKRQAVIFNIKEQFIILEGDRNPDGMFIFVVKAVGNDVGEQFIKRQVGFKDTFFGQAHGFTKLFQLLAQGVQFGQITFKFK
jgi:hypothetical protein